MGTKKLILVPMGTKVPKWSPQMGTNVGAVEQPQGQNKLLTHMAML